MSEFNDFDNTEDAVSIEHNSSSGNEDTVNLQDNMTQDMCPDRSYYLNNIRQLKQELKDLKRREKEERRRKEYEVAAQPAGRGVPLITVVIIAFVFAFLGFIASVVFNAYGSTLVDSLLNINTKKKNNDTYILQPGPQYNIDVDEIDTVSSAVYAKAAQSVVGISVVQTSGVFWDLDVTTLGSGSGVIYTDDGYVITNAHVIDSVVNSQSRTVMPNCEIRVYLKTDLSEFYVAELIGYDTVTDLAVLRINVRNLTPIEFADSDKVIIGETAIAIGSPGGLEFMNSVSKGIISGVNRNIAMDSGSAYDLLQTDAAINPGNSGGALLNSEGKLIGISAIKIVSTDYEGMGFAIASNTIKDIVQKLIKDKIIVRPLLGVTVNTTYNNTIAQEYGYPNGALVIDVATGSCADKAGIRGNDIITKINGVTINNFYELRKELLKYAPGEEIVITLFRISGKKTMEVKVVLDKAP